MKADTINETTHYALILSNCSQHYPYAHTCFWNWKKGMNILVVSFVQFFYIFFSFHLIFGFVLFFLSSFWCRVVMHTVYDVYYCWILHIWEYTVNILLCTASGSDTSQVHFVYLFVRASNIWTNEKQNEKKQRNHKNGVRFPKPNG